MNTLIEIINSWGHNAFSFLVPLAWQSSLLILVVTALDRALERKVRPAVRYAIWLLVLVKLALPPSMALPTGAGWWIRSPALPVAQPKVAYTLTYGEAPNLDVTPATAIATSTPRTVRLSWPGVAMLLSLAGSIGLTLCLLRRWRQVNQLADGGSESSGTVLPLLVTAAQRTQLRQPPRLRITERSMSPAVYGLRHPMILLPRTLVDHLEEEKLEAVLLHECIHIQRRDTLINCAQTLLQIIYWWHPLLWLANARIRRLREQAVDDAVMAALEERREVYAPALLAVARLSLGRLPATLGLAGILESKSALNLRIERLLDFSSPPRAGLTLLSLAGIAAFAAVALPMGQPPAPAHSPEPPLATENPWPDPAFSGYAAIALETESCLVPTLSLAHVLPSTDFRKPLVLSSTELAALEASLQQGALPKNPSLPFQMFSGGRFRWRIGGSTNNSVSYQTVLVGQQTTVTGAEVESISNVPDWQPLILQVVPWKEADSIRCDVELSLAEVPGSARDAQLKVPSGGAMIWGCQSSKVAGYSQLILLRHPATQPALDPTIPGAVEKSTPNSAANEESMASLRATLAASKQSPPATNSEIPTRSREQTGSATGSKELDAIVQRLQDVRNKRLGHQAYLPTASKGVPAITQRLQNIRIERLSFDRTPLQQVIEELNRLARQPDPQRHVNFVLKPNRGFNTDALTNSTARIDTFPITIKPELVNIRLVDVLDAIVQSHPAIHYTIEDYGVVFAAAGAVGPATGLLVQAVAVDTASKQVLIQAQVIDSKGLELNSLFPAEVDLHAGKEDVGVIEGPQHKVLVRALEQSKGIDLSQPQLITLSGRQAQIQLVHTQAVGFKAIFPKATNTYAEPVIQSIACGLVVEVTPVVISDGWILLNVRATVTEFLGYSDPEPDLDGVMALFPLPRVRVRTLTAQKSIAPGQVLLLKNPATVIKTIRSPTRETVQRVADKNDLVLFVSADLIDETGNLLPRK